MKYHKSFHLLIFFFTSILKMAASANAEEPTLPVLMLSAPIIDSSDKKYESIQLEGFWNDDDGRTLIRFRSLYRAPDRHSLVLTDARDGTPIVLASQNKMLVYDPLKGCVHYYAKANAETLIGFENGLFEYKFPLRIEGDDPSRIRLDVKSLLDCPSRNDKITTTGEGQYRLTRTSIAGNYYIFDINDERQYKYKRIELVMADSSKARFCINHIVVDAQLKDEAFEFPKIQELANIIPVREHSGVGLVDSVQSLADLTRTFYARFWALYPEERDSPNLANLFGQVKIDWDLIGENDKKYARAIKKTVSLKLDR